VTTTVLPSEAAIWNADLSGWVKREASC